MITLPRSTCSESWRLIKTARIEHMCAHCAGTIAYLEPYVLHQTGLQKYTAKHYHTHCVEHVLTSA